LKLKQACEEQDQRPIEFKRRVVAEVFLLIRKEKQIPRFARNDNLWLLVASGVKLPCAE
jgi:hypothetical protein